MTASRIRVVAFLGLAVLSGQSAALSVPELERLLQASPRDSVSFVETRESPWLTLPVQSTGTMRSGPDVLEKRLETPRIETWRMLTDRVEWVGPDGTTTRQILFSQSPGLAVLADTLRRVVAGDLANLDRTFKMETRGNLDNWILRLHPRGGDSARYLDHVELEGGRGEIRVISVVERQGERTTTRLHPR
jgi:hypothetical protein